MSGSSADRDVVERATIWRDQDPDPATRAELDALLAANDLPALLDRFAGRLQFGTAGLRGALGAGPNRMNRALVRMATAGVATWLRRQGHDGPVVIGRDARHGSDDFAREAARVLAGAGFSVAMLPAPLPTPVTAFAVTHLDAAAGIMITASHNPPADNGYKLYLADGAQIVPPVDAEISGYIDAVGSPARVPVSDESIDQLGPEVLDAYLDGVASLMAPSGPRSVTAVYTPLHGVGAGTLRMALARCGFPAAHEVPEQVDPDPTFPTVAFPNPEEPGALDLALARAQAVDADLVIANDPDADRLAVAAPEPRRAGRWRPLTGDELGVLLADHLLRTRAVQPDEVLATTVVSSRLLERLATATQVPYAESLTGFKWVVRAPGPGRRLLFGYEEALGYCVGDLVHDKDGVSAAMLALELSAALKAEGRSIFDRLAEIYEAHGAHATAQRSIRLDGSDWLDRVTAVMAAIRSQPPEVLAGRRVVSIEDLLLGERLPPSDVLVLSLAGARLVVRPSGTEPKVKAYAEAVVEVERSGGVWDAHDDATEIVAEVLAAAEAMLRERGL